MKIESLRQFLDEAPRCTRCSLSEIASRKVLPEGARPGPNGKPQVEVLFVGEAPGVEENLHGKPFIGASGQLLRAHLQRTRYNPSNSAICNTVLCWPGMGNPNPTQDQIQACAPHLEFTVQFTDPLMIVALGSVAAKTLTGFRGSITDQAGKCIWSDRFQKPVMLLPHPAYYARGKSSKIAEAVSLIEEAVDIDVGPLYEQHNIAPPFPIPST